MRLHRPLACLALILSAAPRADAAPRPWLLPSETTLTGSGDEWLTVDAAISTDLYYFDHPGQDWEPVVTAPDGSAGTVANAAKGRLRKVFDVNVTRRGTYKIAVRTQAVVGTFLLAGERRPIPRGTTPATLATALPSGASDVLSAVATTRLETFVTAGEPTLGAFKPVGEGIEMVPVSHPTDLAMGERATFRFLLDGKPAPGLYVSVVNGGVRYANRLQQMLLRTDAQGQVRIDWPAPGMWWVSATNAAPRGGEGAPAARAPDPTPERRDTYAMTVQVLG